MVTFHSSHVISEDISIDIADEIWSVKDRWNSLVPNEWFHNAAYLDVLEKTNPPDINNLYIVIKKNGIDVGTLLLQHSILRTKKSFNYEQYSTDKSRLAKLWQKFSQWVVSRFTFKLMTIGSLYLTGNYGINLPDNWTWDEKFQLTQRIVDELQLILKRTVFQFEGQLYKDYLLADTANEKSTTSELVSFQIDPNMILSIHPSWGGFDDYLMDMKSKYRVRMKSALKKAKDLTKRPMTLEEMCEHKSSMYALYSSVLEGAGFVLAKGNQDYFVRLKENIGADYHVVGYWLGEELIGFYTWILEGEKMDTHFIGFRHDLNSRYQIYLNILLDLVKDGIEVGAKQIYFFRTALEIKSSVGAVPHDMMVYFRHNKNWFNKLIIKRFFTSFVPTQAWVQRHPFKDDAEDEA